MSVEDRGGVELQLAHDVDKSVAHGAKSGLLHAAAQLFVRRSARFRRAVVEDFFSVLVQLTVFVDSKDHEFLLSRVEFVTVLLHFLIFAFSEDLLQILVFVGGAAGADLGDIDAAAERSEVESARGEFVFADANADVGAGTTWSWSVAVAAGA